MQIGSWKSTIIHETVTNTDGLPSKALKIFKGGLCNVNASTLLATVK